MKKKLSLDLDFTSEYKLFGIACMKEDYWFAYQLNQFLGFQFTREDDFKTFSTLKNKELSLPFFMYNEELSGRQYFLIANKKDEKIFPQIKSIDFYILVKDDGKSEELRSHLTRTIKKIKGVLLVQNIPTHTLKDFKNVILDLEMSI